MHWVRDRAEGRMTLAEVVRWLSHDTAALMGLNDRGELTPGKRADINVIDFDGLHLHAPEITNDLPGDMPRIIQRAEGYTATIVNGTPVYRDGEPTGDLPGRLIRAGAA